MMWFLIFLLLSAAPADSQTAREKRPSPPKAQAARPQVWPIESLSVQGNKRYSTAAILAASGLKTGQPGDKEKFDAARDRLVATGVFETVGYLYEPGPAKQGYAVVFEVSELDQVYPFRFESLPLPPDQLEAALRSALPLLTDQIPATQQLLDRSVKAIEAYLEKNGQPEKVAGRLIADGPDELVIVFRPAASAPAVAEVKFSGNSVIPSTALMNAIGGVAVGVPYSEKRFRLIMETSIRPLYEARGRIRVSFPSLSVEKARDVDGLIVTVQVDEGESYSLGEVSISGVGASPDELRRIGNFKTGDLADFNQVEEGRQRIHQSLKRQGYMSVSSKIQRTVDDKARKVDLAIAIEPGPQYVFRKLTIEGLDLHGEPAVRKLWALKEGKPFDANYPDFFLAEIDKRGIFDNLGKTRSSVKIDEENRAVDVTLYFR